MTDAHDPKSASVQARQQVAGRIGFGMGCVAALVAGAINFVRAPRPLSFGIVLLILLMAALNIPIGIALGLLGERVTRRA
jgi:hypothetical protein